jgi:enolase-like protein/mandelate racemase/muconate lactonizing enzyme-like protein
LRVPVETAGGTLATARLVLVDLTTREGVVGRSYASVYSPRALDPLARLIEGCAELVVGTAADLRADLEVIGAVRAAIGPGAELMVEYNQSLSVEEAIIRGRALDAEGLAWIEEPTRATDLAGASRLAERHDIPVSSHVFPELSSHLPASTPTAHASSTWTKSARSSKPR